MKCCPLGDPWACTTATCAVTCWPFWFCPFGDVSDSATRIWESLESDDSNGTTSITLTLPEGAVCKIIFFCERKKVTQQIQPLLILLCLTWLRFTWCNETGVSCVVRWPSDKVLVVFEFDNEVFASESSLFVTEVTVMKFLAVAKRVAIVQLHSAN